MHVYDSEAVSPRIKKIRDVFEKRLGADWEQWTPDSFDIVELIMEFEDDLDVTIPDDVAEKIKTVGDLIDWLIRHSPP
jgi:acyl carrier protein